MTLNHARYPTGLHKTVPILSNLRQGPVNTITFGSTGSDDFEIHLDDIEIHEDLAATCSKANYVCRPKLSASVSWLCDCVNTGRGWAVDADSTAGYARECYNGAGPDAACNFQSSGGGSGGYGQIQDEESEGCRFWVYIKIVTSQ
ncbi:hypothetical protein V501_10299 [Pseudogymnoascus sp. VKM F-4519 (FW-2642)]|nr:hypothetical protein V501_10299 [Pseudogymnoascus sp. VKM F-4519 (FW-2642)]